MNAHDADSAARDEVRQEVESALSRVRLVAQGAAANLRELKGCEVIPSEMIELFELLADQAAHGHASFRELVGMDDFVERRLLHNAGQRDDQRGSP